MRALRESHGADKITLCIQKTKLDRAIELASMTSLVDAAEYVEFDPCPALKTGYAENVPSLDVLLWPNAVLDNGGTLDSWLPHLKTERDFEVRTPDMGEPRAIVYASSEKVNKAWMTQHDVGFWRELIERVREQFGAVTLVGADWDASFRDKAKFPDDVADLVGKTTLPELAGLLRNARVVIGVISGITIIANHFRTPCVAMWPGWRFPDGFAYSWVAAGAPYQALRANESSPRKVILAAERLAR
jgi:hypothetical protein